MILIVVGLVALTRDLKNHLHGNHVNTKAPARMYSFIRSFCFVSVKIMVIANLKQKSQWQN